MKFNDIFDTDEVLAWNDGDPQDGTYDIFLLPSMWILG